MNAASWSPQPAARAAVASCRSCQPAVGPVKPNDLFDSLSRPSSSCKRATKVEAGKAQPNPQCSGVDCPSPGQGMHAWMPRAPFGAAHVAKWEWGIAGCLQLHSGQLFHHDVPQRQFSPLGGCECISGAELRLPAQEPRRCPERDAWRLPGAAYIWSWTSAPTGKRWSRGAGALRT